MKISKKMESIIQEKIDGATANEVKADLAVLYAHNDAERRTAAQASQMCTAQRLILHAVLREIAEA